MAGLQLGVMGRMGVAPGGSGFSSSPGNGTATDLGFGAGALSSTTPDGSMGDCLTPNDPFGIAFWAALVSIGLLLVVRHSLPA